jgi:hypothetical protein
MYASLCTPKQEGCRCCSSPHGSSAAPPAGTDEASDRTLRGKSISVDNDPLYCPLLPIILHLTGQQPLTTTTAVTELGLGHRHQVQKLVNAGWLGLAGKLGRT